MKAKRLLTSLLAAVVSTIGLVGLTGSATPAGAATATDPVVIVAGTFAGQGLASVYYAPLAARLRADGYKAYIFGQPQSGLGDSRDAAAALNAFVDGVRAQTGAAKVDLIGHSQGGMISRYYIKHLGGSGEVDSLINLAAVNYGTAVANIAKLLGLGNCVGVVSCQQMSIGSSFLADLNAGDDTIGNVSYTNFGTIYDTIIVPYTNSYLANDGNNTNVTVQSQCWARYVDHISIPLNGAVYSGVQDALAHRAIGLNCFAL